MFKSGFSSQSAGGESGRPTDDGEIAGPGFDREYECALVSSWLGVSML